MKMLMAVVRTTCRENIIKELAHSGIRNLTVSEVRGIGEQVTLNEYTVHNLIQIIVPHEKVNEIESTFFGSLVQVFLGMVYLPCALSITW
ncbi:MAG TPA: P-II family nitrogen regulator [Syntrophales bacterium]|nr:P-II family nitrogen regulator [Syntrophales bacterium]